MNLATKYENYIRAQSEEVTLGELLISLDAEFTPHIIASQVRSGKNVEVLTVMFKDFSSVLAVIKIENNTPFVDSRVYESLKDSTANFLLNARHYGCELTEIDQLVLPMIEKEYS